MKDLVIKTYKEFNSLDKDHFFDFCKLASTNTKEPASANMWDEDWENKKHTLPYLLEKTNRFNNDGDYHII